jgi:hypothetical protein
VPQYLDRLKLALSVKAWGTPSRPEDPVIIGISPGHTSIVLVVVVRNQ